MAYTFMNRRAAGAALATQLAAYAGRPDVVVLALPRGGVPVAYEVAVALDVPLDVFVVRKLGVPWNEEYAVGAIASGGTMYIDVPMAAALGLTARDIDRVAAVEWRELARREREYRRGRTFPRIEGKAVILVDDGLATGATMRAAVEAIRTRHPAAVVVAAPVASHEARHILSVLADDCVCILTPEPFGGVGAWYEDFSPTSDDEVRALLARADVRGLRGAGAATAEGAAR